MVLIRGVAANGLGLEGLPVPAGFDISKPPYVRDSGNGANLAMLDGAELGTAIAAHPGDLEAALAAYEAAMFPRSESAALEALDMLATFLGEDARAELMDTLSHKTCLPEEQTEPPRRDPPLTADAV